MQENYRTGMVDPATRVGEYLGRHRRTTGTHRREVPCPTCLIGASGCPDCGGVGVVPMPAVTRKRSTVGRHRADGPAQ